MESIYDNDLKKSSKKVVNIVITNDKSDVWIGSRIGFSSVSASDFSFPPLPPLPPLVGWMAAKSACHLVCKVGLS